MSYSVKVDYVGAFAGSLCLVHCLATPFIFIAKSCTVTCCSDTPLWWSMIDYVFLIISWFAIYKSTKKSKKNWVKVALWMNWVLLFGVLVNERLEWIPLAKEVIYIPSLLIVILHLYNLKYCQCANETCCTK